jgi:hypothetical protein
VQGPDLELLRNWAAILLVIAGICGISGASEHGCNFIGAGGGALIIAQGMIFFLVLLSFFDAGNVRGWQRTVGAIAALALLLADVALAGRAAHALGCRIW